MQSLPDKDIQNHKSDINHWSPDSSTIAAEIDN